MNGVRVQGIDPQCPEKVVWQYFADLCSRASIVDVYYPLLNNNAIVIFENTSAAVKVMTRTHEKWTVLPLPNQVFSKQRVWVDKDLTSLLQDNEHYCDVLKEIGQVQISMEKNTGQMMLTGQSYQIEWAWRYLSDLQDQQQHRFGFFHSKASSSLPNGNTLANGDIDHATMQKHSPTLRSDTRLQNGDVTSPDASSQAAEGTLGGRCLLSLSASAAGSSKLSPTSQNRASGQGRGVNKTKTVVSDVTSLAIEGLSQEAPVSSPNTLPQVSTPNTLTAVSSATSPGQQERALAQGRESSKTRISKANTTRQDAMAIELSEERDHLRSLNAHGNRQISAEGSAHGYASLPVRNSGTSVSNPSKHNDVQVPSSSSNSSRNSRGSPHSVSSTRELSKEEATYTVYRQHQSMNYQMTAPPDEDYGTVGEPQSLQPWDGEQAEAPNSGDMEIRGTYGGQRPFTSLQYSGSSSGKVTNSSKYALLSRSVVELSRKHIDVGHRLKLKIYPEDITKTRTSAVVNAANWELKNIGGVAGALAKAAGPEMAQECGRLFLKNGPLRTAQVVRTKAYGKLSHLRYVLHTVGPIYNTENPDKSVFELAQTFYNCLEFADKLNLESVTFPFISTGIFGMPIERCVLSLITALKRYASERHSNLSSLEEVHFINNDIDIICNAVIFAEDIAKQETEESCTKRMKEGEKLHSRGVFPFCDQKPDASSGSANRERHGTWDSTRDNDVNHPEDTRSHHGSHHQSDHAQPQSLPASVHRSREQSRTATVDQSDTSMSAKAGASGGRDPSPMPKPRSRSNSVSGAEKSDSGSSKKGSSPESVSSAIPKGQPQIKQSITPTPSANKKRSVRLANGIGKGRTSDQSGNDTDLSSAATSETEDTDRKCPICLDDDMKQPKKLPCGHRFCTDCLDRAMAVVPRCPKCQRMFGIPTGTQPSDGTMSHNVSYHSDLPGYPNCGTITITYDFPSGRQEACHPNPGRHYDSTHRVAYLPNNMEGRDVLKMLHKAFDHRLVFTIGDSVTTGAKGAITWNDIHHKTSTYGGPQEFGYPDPGYLIRVKEELAAKGITRP